MSSFPKPEHIAGTFAAHPPLCSKKRFHLVCKGVPPQALDIPSPLRVAEVHFVPLGRFEFNEFFHHPDPERALLSLVCDSTGTPLDIVAWHSFSRRLAT